MHSKFRFNYRVKSEMSWIHSYHKSFAAYRKQSQCNTVLGITQFFKNHFPPPPQAILSSASSDNSIYLINFVSKLLWFLKMITTKMFSAIKLVAQPAGHFLINRRFWFRNKVFLTPPRGKFKLPIPYWIKENLHAGTCHLKLSMYSADEGAKVPKHNAS